jgi:predicted alpha-1,6-mannanase (GH76 family)
LKSSGLVTPDWTVYDGIDAADNCAISRARYSYSPGILLGALGWLYKTTNQASYASDASTLLTATLSRFAPNGILTDSCEPNCPLNAVTFKGPFARGLGFLYEFTPDSTVREKIKDALSKSVTAMVATCDSSWNCGNNWASGIPNPQGRSVHDQMVSIELMTAYYKTFGISMKYGLIPPVGAKPAEGNNGVGPIPKGAATSVKLHVFTPIAIMVLVMFLV